jgi:hypothetical protein
MRKWIAILTSIFILILFSLKSLYSEEIRIAVMEFKPDGVSKRTVGIVTGWIRTEIANVADGYIIIERGAMNMILKEQGFQQTGCVDETCAVKAGRLLSANKILVGTIAKWGSKVIISGRLIDVEKGITECGHKETVNSVEELDKGAEYFVKNLMRIIEGKAPIEKEIITEKGIKLGCVKGNCKNGNGTYIYPDGESKYIGRWTRGKRNGRGNYKGKCVYVSCGMSVEEFNIEYNGSWKNDIRDGYGIFKVFDGKYAGRKYVGQWKNGKLNGKGTFTWPNGRKYVGQWKNGKPNGKGTMYYPDGSVKKGKWVNGRLLGSGG